MFDLSNVLVYTTFGTHVKCHKIFFSSQNHRDTIALSSVLFNANFANTREFTENRDYSSE